jgi:hypothetical protein
MYVETLIWWTFRKTKSLFFLVDSSFQEKEAYNVLNA